MMAALVVFGAAVFSCLTSGAAEIIRPDIGEPLRDAAVTRAPDGTYYLTGTRSSRAYSGRADFLFNDGVRLWSSRDLVNWKGEGLVYDLMQRTQWHDYLTQWYALPERPLGARSARGMTSPRLFVHDGAFYLTFSNAGHDVRWMRASRPEGPYRDYRKTEGFHKYADPLVLSNGPGHGSLFRDADGAVWLVRGPGYLARVKPDLSDTVEGSSKFLLARVAGYPNAQWCARQFDPRAASLFLRDGQYILTWAAYTDEAGFKRDDSFYAVSDSLMGPYSEPRRFLPGSGPVVLFDGGRWGLMLSCSIEDHPVLAPVDFSGGVLTVAAEIQRPPGISARSAQGRPLEMFDYAHSRPSGSRAQLVERTGRHRLVPLFDLPLRDICIARGHDAWYLTGTTASKTPDADFQNNDGVYLWRSEDLNTWLPLGKVWDIDTSTSLSAGKDGGVWQKQYRIPGNNPVREDFCRGVTAPEIHFAEGTYWIAYSMNGRGTGLLKSTTGRAEGPYEDLGRITGMGESPSLFTDRDGKTYWLWGRGLQMAPLAESLARITGPATDLFLAWARTYPDRTKGYTVNVWDVTAPHLFVARDPKTERPKYALSFSAVTQVFERASRDSVIVLADNLEGPYIGPTRMMPHGGQTSVFESAAGELFASFSGADPSAVFRDRPAIVPMEWSSVCNVLWPRAVWGDYHTERGPWAEVLPVKGLEDIGIVDPHVFKAPDDYYYFSCSPQGMPARYHDVGGLRYWRARNLQGPWEDVGLLYSMEQMRDDPDWPAIESEKDLGWNNSQFAWEPSMAYAKDTYWLSLWFGGHGWGRDVVWKKSIGALLRSTTGGPEGPYAYHSQWSHDWQGLFVDADGSVYGTSGAGMIWRMNEELTAVDEGWTDRHGRPYRSWAGPGKAMLRASGDGQLMSEDCGYQMLKVNGRYVFMGLSGYTSYDMRVFWADDIRGPYHYMGVIPRQGNSPIIQDRQGRWMTAFPQCGNVANFSAPFRGTDTYKKGSAFTYEVVFDWDAPRPGLWPAHDFGHVEEAVYQARTEEFSD